MTSTLQKQVTEAAAIEAHPPPAAKRPRPNSAGQASSVKAPAAAAPKPSASSAKPKSPAVAEVVARTALATKAAATAAMSDDEEGVHTLAPAGPARGPSLAGAATVETAKGPAGGARQSIGSSRSELAPVSGGPSNGKQHAVEGSSHKKKKKRRSGHGGGGGSGSPAGQL